MDQKKKAYFDELGASGEWKTEYFLQAELAWQMKRIADSLERLENNGCESPWEEARRSYDESR